MSLFNDKPGEPSFGTPQQDDWWDNLKSFAWETLKVVIISLAIILPVRYFLVQPFYVEGASMQPSFQDKEYLIIDEISYRFTEPQRGDVVVFKYPRDNKQFFIKRIIGMPGEQVSIHDNTITIINDENPQGFVLNEAYLGSDVKTVANLQVSLDNDEYYVLGDNRGASLDSRNFGPVQEDEIIGHVWIRGWPLDRVQTFETPEY